MKTAVIASPFGPILLLAAALSSCGGTPSQTHSSAQAAPPNRGLSKQAASTTTTQPSSAPAANGIETFGHSAGSTERAVVTAAVGGYTLALVADDGVAACSRLTASLRAQASGIEASKVSGVHGGCSHLLGSMFAYQAPQTRAATRDTRISAVRVAGSRAFAVIRQPGMQASFYPLQREDGQWKIAAIGPTILPTSRSGR